MDSLADHMMNSRAALRAKEALGVDTLCFHSSCAGAQRVLSLHHCAFQRCNGYTVDLSASRLQQEVSRPRPETLSALLMFSMFGPPGVAALARCSGMSAFGNLDTTVVQPCVRLPCHEHTVRSVCASGTPTR